MQRSRYKYFSKLDYAKQFLDGNMYCQTAAFFRDYEDAKAQGASATNMKEHASIVL
jgi:hypothetical protein